MEKDSEVWRGLGDMRTKERKREERPSYTIPVVALHGLGFIDV